MSTLAKELYDSLTLNVSFTKNRIKKPFLKEMLKSCNRFLRLCQVWSLSLMQKIFIYILKAYIMRNIITKVPNFGYALY